MVGIVRLYHDSYGDNVGSRIFCQLSKYFGGVLITDNKKIIELNKFKTITHREAVMNRKKFTKLLVYNSKPNMFGGLAPKHTPDVVRLILSIPDVYYYTSDPILDLQLSVPDSHEKSVPGLTKAVMKMIYDGKKLTNADTDLVKNFTANLEIKPIELDAEKKDWVCAYFGNSRGKKRQEQVFQLLNPLKSKLIIGHEHEHFPWFYYTPDFYNLVSTAYVTPIIGDDKLHYETGTTSIRLYETWYTTTIGLVDSRFKEPMLSKKFFFSTPEEFHQKAKAISENPLLYLSMIKEQRRCLRELIKKYKKKKWNWKKVLKAKKLKEKEQLAALKLAKKQKVDAAKERLIKKQILKPKKNENKSKSTK